MKGAPHDGRAEGTREALREGHEAVDHADRIFARAVLLDEDHTQSVRGRQHTGIQRRWRDSREREDCEPGHQQHQHDPRPYPRNRRGAQRPARLRHSSPQSFAKIKKGRGRPHLVVPPARDEVEHGHEREDKREHPEAEVVHALCVERAQQPRHQQQLAADGDEPRD